MIIDRASTEELRKLTARLIEGQEAERSRLARELHDDVSQRLALLAVNLRLLERSVPNATAGVQASIGDLYSEVQALGRDVRRMSHALHPARLEQVGLVSALRGLCADMSAAYGITITFDADGSQDVTERRRLVSLPGRAGSAAERRQAQRRDEGSGRTDRVRS